tara:strand:- start:1748 stop:2878 length:1131 start_codon:yes stop_codon:yes gene_type:complete
MKKKILFVTSTRADFGKIKPLIKIVKKNNNFTVNILVTGMHMLTEYGSTHTEIDKFFKSGVIKFKNQIVGDKLEKILTETIQKFSKVVKEIKPDLIIIHGDRVEPLACALVGSLNHILTAHIEGGEVSGNIDDTIRHAISKLSHIHFVGNDLAKKRLINMGEKKNSIFKIGSPDIDAMLSDKLPSLKFVKKRYGIKFSHYAILLWHPVTSELKNLKKSTKKLVKFINNFNTNFIVIYSNNDPGTKQIINIYKKNLNKKKTKLFRSIRFENFLTLLKNSKFIIGNSSAGIYEAPVFGIPTINIGSRQHNRTRASFVKNLEINELKIKKIKQYLLKYKIKKISFYGYGGTDIKFLNKINKKSFWNISKQKYFSDMIRL